VTHLTSLPIIIAAGLAAYLVSVAIVPVVMRLATSRRLLDLPDGIRHSHTHPIPRLGGVAVFGGLLIGYGVVLFARTPESFAAVPKIADDLILAGAILFLIGLLDDLRGVPPIAKLAGQTLAALIVCYDGFRIDAIHLPPAYQFSLGWFSIPITVLWLVGISNAFNLVDGLDGLAGGVAVIALVATTAAAVILGNMSVPWYTGVLIGALLGFLRYNHHPARIFLGDSGSLVVGFLLAVLTVRGAKRADGVLYALAPIFALSYPLLDTGIAMLRRWLRGAPLSRADTRHIHHQLRALGLSPRRAATVIYLESIAIAVLGLCVTFAPPALTVAVAGIGVAILLLMFVYGVRFLQYHEFVEAGASVASVTRNARSVVQDKIVARDIASQIGKAATFEQIDLILFAGAKTFRFAHMQLRRGSVQRALPSFLSADLQDPDLCKLEYPVVNGSVSPDPLLLVIWCSTDGSHRSAGVERIAQILAPAIASWVSARPAHLLDGALLADSDRLPPAVGGVIWHDTPNAKIVGLPRPSTAGDQLPA
jgi:UDP-GlcNAc:undecaprenyl-phosphate/decaprenyl-phosphate GlcNAc-1-phosphate transferase